MVTGKVDTKVSTLHLPGHRYRQQVHTPARSFMPQQRTALGERGKITCHPYIVVDGRAAVRPAQSTQRPDYWEASTRVRTGEAPSALRRIRAEGKTRDAALNRLHLKVQDVVDDVTTSLTGAPAGGSTNTTTLADHLDVWLTEQQHRATIGDRAIGTVIRYRQAVNSTITPRLGSQPIGKITTGQIARFLANLTPAVAKTCRGILRAAFDQALIDGAVKANPAVGLPRVNRPRSTIHRATGLDRRQADDLLDNLYSDPLAVTADIPDVLLLIACTGCRTAEALALAWTDVDFTDGTVTISATVNANGQRQEHTKTSAGMRTLSIPPRAVTMLHRRAEAQGGYSTLVYPAERMGTGNTRDHDTPRWTTNFTGQVRRFLDMHGYPDITSRSLRKMVATELDKAGLTGRQIADQLGHAKPSITMDIYQIRIGQGPKQAATLLE